MRPILVVTKDVELFLGNCILLTAAVLMKKTMWCHVCVHVLRGQQISPGHYYGYNTVALSDCNGKEIVESKSRAINISDVHLMCIITSVGGLYLLDMVCRVHMVKHW